MFFLMIIFYSESSTKLCILEEDFWKVNNDWIWKEIKSDLKCKKKDERQETNAAAGKKNGGHNGYPTLDMDGHLKKIN